MSREANPTIIGGFVLGALALVIIGILVFSSGTWMRDRIELVTYFPGSVQGLSVGAEVQFQGVRIGQVVAIGLDYVADRDSFRIPVKYEVWPDNIHVLGNLEGTAPPQLIRRLVDERGLRAQLESVSFVTGQYLVSLSLNPSRPTRTEQPRSDGLIKVPAVAATRDRVQQMLDNLHLEELVDSATETLGAIRELVKSQQTRSTLDNLNEALERIATFVERMEQELSPLSERVQGTLSTYEQLGASLQSEIKPTFDVLQRAGDELAELSAEIKRQVPPIAGAAQGALDEAAAAMQSVNSFAAEDSPTRYQLEQLFSTATQAARSIRSLADYLERHPEALLQGKQR
jgi:paraquat-inducible protein B